MTVVTAVVKDSYYYCMYPFCYRRFVTPRALVQHEMLGHVVTGESIYVVIVVPGSRKKGIEIFKLLNRGTLSFSDKINGFCINCDSQGVKYSLTVKVNFVQATDSSIITDPPPVLTSPQYVCVLATDLCELLLDGSHHLEQEIGEY